MHIFNNKICVLNTQTLLKIQILELLIPIFMVYVLVLIKNAVDSVGDLDSEIIEASFPTEYDAFSPLVFDDYLTALQAKRNCTIGDNDDFFISGYQYNGFDWQVPLIKCDSRLCNENGQDASTSLCEYNIIGVAGNKTRALQFVSWLEGKYPILADRSKLPFNFSLIRSFESGDEMDTYVTSIDYGKYPMNPKLAIGIIFNDDDNPNMYDYTIRQNSTNFNSPEQEGRPATRTTPNTEQLLNEYTKDDRQACVTEGGTPYLGSLEYSCAGQYMYNGVLTFQRLINDFIIDQTTGDDSTYVGQGSVQYAPFPSRSYKDAGFYAQIGGK